MRFCLLALILVLLPAYAFAQSPCNSEPNSTNAQACDGEAFEAEAKDEGPMNEILQEVGDELDAIAKINSNFADSKKILMESQDFWQQYRIKDCDAHGSAYLKTNHHAALFANCMGNHALERTIELRGYLASLAPYSPTPQQRIALEEKFVCDISGIEQGSATPADRCFMRAAAKRCNQSDACMIQCLKGGGAKNIAGGCYHVCRYADPKHPLESENPSGWQACSVK